MPGISILSASSQVKLLFVLDERALHYSSWPCLVINGVFIRLKMTIIQNEANQLVVKLFTF